MSLNRLGKWFHEGLPCRVRNLRRWYINRVVGPLSARSSALARRAFWPIPGSEPYRRANLHVSREGALGDVLLCTPALREVKRLNPTCRITFYTDYPQLVRGLPFIDELRKFAGRPPRTIELTYEHRIPPTRHISRIVGEVLGVSVRDVRPICVVDGSLVTKYRDLFRALPRPHVVINRDAGPWTPNKDWPAEYWEKLVSMLTKKGSVIEIGAAKEAKRPLPFQNSLSLVGKTTLPELIAAIAAVDVLVSPDSGPTHIAAAVNVPSVVIFGGYTSPNCLGYPGNINLSNSVECAPCWLRSPCPYDRKCLRAIFPEYVFDGVLRLARSRQNGTSYR